MPKADNNNNLLVAAIAFAICAYSAAGSAQILLAQRELADLTLEELSNITITTVSRREESQMEAPASVFVITADMIRRSGVTTIAEALRLAPGVEVARRGPDTWAISIRGFNSDIANKLLVLIDGRSVYSPLYAGVFWDVQDTLIEDIDRIEVISGPGGTLWGANAVNGVVNIITRSAFDTQGGFVEIGGGSREPDSAGFRYGMRPSDDTAARVYVKYLDIDREGDERRRGQGGFRLDRESLASDRLTLQGDIYRGEKAGLFRPDFELGELPGPPLSDEQVVAGHNLLARWVRPLGDGFDLRLQFYYDHTRRDIPGTYNERRDTFDFDFQHGLRPASGHEIIWGLAFRHTRDDIDNTLLATFDPASRSDRTWGAFIQDKIELSERQLFLTLGSKFEHNDYTGFELQPNARLSWLASERQMAWAAVSRAVRIPSRLDTDLRLTTPVPLALPEEFPQPVYFMASGSDAFRTETLVAYELGYRAQATSNLSFDTALFYNDYNHVQAQSLEAVDPVDGPPSYTALRFGLTNETEGEAYGTVLTVNWHPRDNWRLQLHHSWLEMRIRSKPGAENVSPLAVPGNSPSQQVALRSYLDVTRDVQLYAGLRWVDVLAGAQPEQRVDSYAAFDLSLRWWPNDDLEISVTGQNLNDDSHVEFASGGRYEVERSVHGRVTWRF